MKKIFKKIKYIIQKILEKILKVLLKLKLYIIYDFIIGVKNIKTSLHKRTPKIKFNTYFGVPGSGKTTVAAWLTRKSMRKGRKVFSNVPLKNAYKISREDIGNYDIRNCDLIIDEVGIEYSNRDFKSFKKEELQFFKLHRHYKVNVYMFSQAYNDADKKMRDLSTRYYVVKRSIIPYFIVMRRLSKRVGIDKMTKQIIDEYYYFPWLFGTRYIFMPSLWTLFNSYSAPKLKHKDFYKYNDV